MNIRVDKKFKDLIPPLTDEERRQLEENIEAAGKAYDAIKVWEGKIVDGHNRYEICRKLKLPFKVEELKFESRDHAMIWMIDNQAGRRNVEVYCRVSMLTLRDDLIGGLVEKHGGDRKSDDFKSLNSDTCSGKNSGRRTTKIAELAGCGRDTVDKVLKINKAHEAGLVPEETIENLRTGESSIHSVFADVRRNEKREELVEKLESVSAKKQKALKGHYDVIVIDPPWPMQKIERDVAPNQVKFDYPTMSEEELAALKMPAADDCHMWLWTTHKFLPMAYRLLDVWNFKYVCCFVWHKPGGFQPIGLPQYNCEFALYARRGSPKFIDTKAFNTCFDAPRGKHSEKPEEFYDVVRRVTGGRRIDIFNRRKIKGFDVWGKEA